MNSFIKLSAKNRFLFIKPSILLYLVVCNDSLTHQKKGRTVMNEDERYEALRHCRYVDEVVIDAPWTLTDDYLDKHKVRPTLNILLTLNVPIVTKFVCFSCLLKCLRCLYGKQCGPRSDCSIGAVCSGSTLFACILKFVSNVRFLHLFYFYRCYGNKNGRQNRLKIEKLPFWAKFKAFVDQFCKK